MGFAFPCDENQMHCCVPRRFLVHASSEATTGSLLFILTTQKSSTSYQQVLGPSRLIELHMCWAHLCALMPCSPESSTFRSAIIKIQPPPLSRRKHFKPQTRNLIHEDAGYGTGSGGARTELLGTLAAMEEGLLKSKNVKHGQMWAEKFADYSFWATELDV